MSKLNVKVVKSIVKIREFFLTLTKTDFANSSSEITHFVCKQILIEEMHINRFRKTFKFKF